MENINRIKVWFAALVGVLTGLWGWMGWLVMGWIACMALDYITGSMAAKKAGQWSSGKAREGVWHKAGMIVVVIVAAIADIVISIVLKHLPMIDLPFEYAGLVTPVVLVWYILTELGSIIENAVTMGAKVPKWLKNGLEVSRDMVDRAGETLREGEKDMKDNQKKGEN